MKKNNQPTETQSSHFWRSVFGGIMGTVLVLSLVSVLGFGLLRNNQPTAYSQEDLIEFESTITQTVQETQEAVVSVGNYQTIQSNPFGQRGYIEGQGLQLEDIQQEPVLVGTGSGVVYKVDGDTAYVVTNNHVIAGHDSLEVTLADGTQIEATEVGSDLLSDLAVLQISSESVTDVIEFANSDDTQVGSIAIAIGSPLDSSTFASTVTQGIVSGLNRLLPIDTDGDGTEDWEMTLLQTDAAINPGNSGGALVNSNGQLIGINSSKIATSTVEGMGFAIPSNDVQQIIEQLEANGEVVRPVLGTTTVNLNYFALETRVQDLGLAEDMTDGTVVVDVMANSSAAAAGVEQFDVITAINDEPVTDGQVLRQLLYKYQVGDTVTLTVIRGGEEQQVEVTLDAAPTANTQPAQESQPQD
ncbi:trypsin-like peptidase domain-containing protein [Aerococcaceae bacterium DSM 111021]|nr:trypsin-like peptidase domain-containing protein [Aerococcaceae bacterium DSM 111021]